jgi:signal transduction histidine kinase
VEKQKTQEELKTSLAILSASLEATADGIVVTGLDREIINVNEKFFRIFNIPVVGSRIDSVPFVQHYLVKYINDSYAYNEKLEEIYANPELPSFDLLAFRNGRWVERFSQPLYINGECNGLVWSYRDVTQNQKDGADLLEKNKELEKTNGELDRFVYSVSHELRAPLLSILGLVNIAEAETSEPEVKQYCNLMRTSVDRLDGFIQNIIYYSQNSRSALNRELIIFEKLAQEAFNTMKYVDSHVTINTSINIHQDFPFYSDKASLNVILGNLVTNAAKFRTSIEGAEPKVDIDIKVTKSGACIIVSDNGEGIASEYHQKLFDMFFRVSGKAGGSGLGLYVVKEIIDKLNGSIRVESEQGFGSRFIIELPHNNGHKVS